MRAYFSGTANLQAFGSKRFHFTIELKISLSVRFGQDLLISFGSTVRNWNCDNPIPTSFRYLPHHSQRCKGIDSKLRAISFSQPCKLMICDSHSQAWCPSGTKQSLLFSSYTFLTNLHHL